MSIAAKNALLWGVEAVFRAFSPDEKPKNLASKGVQECVFNFLQAYCVKMNNAKLGQTP